MAQLATSASWRKVFLVPLILGTYYWLAILKDEVLADVKEMGERDLAQTITSVPAIMLQKLSLSPMGRSVLLEFFFLNCFCFVLMTLLFYKRRGATGYITASFFTNSALGVGFCNYLFPITSLEFQHSVLQKECQELEQPDQGKKKGKRKPPPKKVTAPSRVLDVPAINQWVFTLLVLCVLLLIKVYWKTSKLVAAYACLYFPVVYLSLPVALTMGYVAKGQKATLDSAKTKKLMLVWLVAGIAVAYYTRIGGGFPITKLDFTSMSALQESFTRVFIKRIGNKGVPTSYLAFAAQIVTLNTTCALFTIMGGTIALPLRILLCPLYFLCPTIATPLYFLFHDFTDHRMIEVEEAAANAVSRKEE